MSQDSIGDQRNPTGEDSDTGAGERNGPHGYRYLEPHHIKLLTGRGISPEVATARKVRTETVKAQLGRLGFGPSQRIVPALVIPIFDTSGERVNTQTRPDVPRADRNGKTVKYETPAGSKITLDIPPALDRAKLRDTKEPLLVTEGPLKADSAVSHGLTCIALLGVWNWKTEQALADWDNIPMRNREVAIAFDSDVMTKPPVHQALSRLKAFLEKRGARVKIVYLPEGPDGDKVGLDDFLATGHEPAELWRLAVSDVRALETQSSDASDELYRQTSTGMVYLKPTSHGSVEVKLTNFSARIVTDSTIDDGTGETQRQFEIEATVAGRRQIVRVPAQQFGAMNWTQSLGVQAIVYAGSSCKDHARVAIQHASQDAGSRHVFTHTGWREENDQWVYLSSSGAVRAGGLDRSYEVQLGGALSGFSLPEPLAGPDLVAAVRAEFHLLDVAPESIMVPILGAVFRAPLGQADCGLHAYGETGLGKSQLAALAQQHFGAGMDAHHLPGSWTSTDNALEAQLHAAKDALCVVDDFVLQGTQSDIARINRLADRVFRGQGNNSGRARMRPDGTLIAPKVPRGLVLSTGEERPRGQSLNARRFDIEVSAGDVNWEVLSECQEAARKGEYAAVMSSFLQSIAANYGEIKAGLGNRVAELRLRATKDGQHRRTPEIVANLGLGWSYFLDFAVQVGAITTEERAAYGDKTWDALMTAADRQAQFQAETDPTNQFLELLRAAITGGHAHVASKDGDDPVHASAWGWRARKVGPDAQVEWYPIGTTVGWLEGYDLYIDERNAYQVAQKVATTSGYPLNIELSTLKVTLNKRGFLKSTDQTRNRLTVRRTLNGQRRTVLHFRRDTIFPAGTNDSSGVQVALELNGEESSHASEDDSFIADVLVALAEAGLDT